VEVGASTQVVRPQEVVMVVRPVFHATPDGRIATTPGAKVNTVVLLLAACLGCLAVAALNQRYFDAVNAVVHAQGAEARGVLYSTWLLLLAVPIVAWRPRTLGLTLGSLRAHWAFVGGITAAAAGITWAVLRAVGPTPYASASAFIEVVDVPITEELLFRGVMLTLLVRALARFHPGRRAVLLAVAIDGIAFGIGHLANATSLDLAFVVLQATFAVALGTACASVMARTGSLYPAILVHAAVNGVVVFS
jgi:membrane protease YdiL (CAAX protease family)